MDRLSSANLPIFKLKNKIKLLITCYAYFINRFTVLENKPCNEPKGEGDRKIAKRYPIKSKQNRRAQKIMCQSFAAKQTFEVRTALFSYLLGFILPNKQLEVGKQGDTWLDWTCSVVQYPFWEVEYKYGFSLWTRMISTRHLWTLKLATYKRRVTRR